MLKRIVSMFVIVIIIQVIFAGCKSKENALVENITTIENTSMQETTEAKENSRVSVDYTRLNSGILIVRYPDKTLKSVNIVVTFNESMINGYIITDIHKDTVIGLNYGAGEYYIDIYTKDECENDVTLYKDHIKMEDIDELYHFTLPTHAVRFNNRMQVIKDAEQMNMDAVTAVQKICNIYDFVMENVSYEEDNVDYSNWIYYPDIETIYEKKTGVCTDYATLFAALCRSQGIPCKVITGNNGKSELHVWVEVYLEDEGIYEYDGIRLEGKTWNRIDPTLMDQMHETYVVSPEYYLTESID